MADATPMSNADFRKLLATPRRPAAKEGSGPAATPQATPKQHGGGGGYKPRKPAATPKPQKPAEDEESKYRDRAEERRRGVNPDYVAANALLGVVGPDGAVDPSKLSVEDTKYLGGDLEHTHLVKGLDFALLNKMRNTMSKKPGAGDKDGGADGDDAEGEGAAAEAAVITHPVARGVYDVLFRPSRVRVADIFLPRRTAFVFDFDPDEFGMVQELPTLLRRSKEDCPPAPDTVFAQVDTPVLERIAKIMTYIKAGAAGKKVKKKERDEVLGQLLGTATGPPGGGGPSPAPAQAPAVPMAAPTAAGAAAAAAHDDDDNIFDDVGTDYKPSVSGKKKPPPAGLPGADDDMDLDQGEDRLGAGSEYAVPPPPPGGPQDPYAVPPPHGQAWPDGQPPTGMPPPSQQPQQEQEEGGDEPRWRVRTRKVEERMVDFVDDAYGEYYPMAGGFEVPTLDEEEDDADPRKARAAEEAAKGQNKAGQATREAASKLNTQMQKIEHMFKAKGYDTGAFGKTPARGGGTKAAPTPSRATGEDPTMSVNVRKRQRI